MSAPFSLPQAPIVATDDPISALFTRHAITTFHDTIRRVGGLPYGRTTDRSDYRLVLSEGRGACSGKHALLAALAAELQLPIELMLGIYEMNEQNTPGVGAALARAGLSSIPEAHCYLRYRGQRFDVTRGGEPQRPSVVFLFEEAICPNGIGRYKIEFHRTFLANWLQKHDGQDLDQVWQVREECIKALTGLNA